MSLRVLLRLPNWVGDVVMATPSILALTKKNYKVSLAVRDNLFPLIESFPQIEKTYKIDKKNIISNYNFLKDVRKIGFDAYIVFPKGFREALLAKFSNSRKTIGYNVNKRGFLFTDGVELTEELWNKHHVFQFGELIKKVDAEIRDEKVFLPISFEDTKNVERLLENENLKEKDFIVFHIGSSKFERAYHAERFGQCAKIIRELTNKKIAVIGGKEDEKYVELFLKECKDATNLLSKTKLSELPALISKAYIFVGNDSGPMHIASAVNTKTVAIFGPGSPKKTAPFMDEKMFRIVYKNFPCSPCKQRFFKECKPSINGKPYCLEEIDPKTVTQAILELV